MHASPLQVPPSPPRRTPIGPGWILAIVGTGAFSGIASLGLIAVVLWWLFGWFAVAPWEDADDEYYADAGFVEGRVLDSAGDEVGGVGTFDDPATAGEHTLVWETGTGVTTVEVTEIDVDAALELEAAGSEVVPAPEGYTYVLVDARVSYEGEGDLDLVEDLWISMETWEDFHQEQYGPVLPGGSLRSVPTLSSGQTAEGQMLFMVREDALAPSALSVEPSDGFPLSIAAI